MYRNAMKELIAWKDNPRRKPLIVNGARQVGKTWLVCAFGAEHFDKVAHIVFLENEEMQRAFEGSLDPNRLLMLISAATGTNPHDGKTLVFFDEIQECPRALTSLKFFCEQCPHIPVIAAGSLLGVALNRGQNMRTQGTSWPVGKVDYLDLYPLTFDEFVRARENDALADLVFHGEADMIDAFSERLTDLLKTYFFVGGMPEVVQEYLDTGDFSAARAVQQRLLIDYEHDFVKHVESALEIERIRQTWHSVPLQLAREADIKRFSYASIKQGGRGRDYRDAISWLVDAGLVSKVERVSKPGLPLAGYADDVYFKLYLLDIGLLGAATGLDAATIVKGSSMFTEYKGAYAEQYVCQQLRAAGAKPYYWSADGKQTKGEVDFIIERNAELLPIEVKAEENITGGSLAAFVKRYDLKRAVRFCLRGFKEQDWLVNIPLYAVNAFLQKIGNG